MRYVIQFLIPLLVFAGVVLLLVRKRRPSRHVEPPDPADEIMTPRAFIGFLVAAGLATLGAMYGAGVLLE